MKRFGAISGLRTWLLPMNKLRLVAPTNVLDAASRVTTALTTTALYPTDPLAQQVARKAAGEVSAGGELSMKVSVKEESATRHIQLVDDPAVPMVIIRLEHWSS